jgi:hypothetical protein
MLPGNGRNGFPEIPLPSGLRDARSITGALARLFDQADINRLRGPGFTYKNDCAE